MDEQEQRDVVKGSRRKLRRLLNAELTQLVEKVRTELEDGPFLAGFLSGIERSRQIVDKGGTTDED